jgi:gluconolactonase
VEATLLASGLGFPEGPVVLPDGGIVFCDGNVGELLLWENGAVGTYAVTGGSPWGAVLGIDGAIYVTQGGNVPGSGDTSAVGGIQRVRRGDVADLIRTEVDGYTLVGPNDLAFGPDGRLWFTDSEAERLFVIDEAGGGEMLFERPGCYPNGIAFDAQKRLYWTESLAHRVCCLDDDGKPTTFAQLSDEHVPDGMAFAADGRLFVATTIKGGVTVLSSDGEILDEVQLGEHATNCIFAGSTLYVTATRTAEIEASERTGTFWGVETDAVGLDLIPGKL